MRMIVSNAQGRSGTSDSNAGNRVLIVRRQRHEENPESVTLIYVPTYVQIASDLERSEHDQGVIATFSTPSR